jgi:hypothetical protein
MKQIKINQISLLLSPISTIVIGLPSAVERTSFRLKPKRGKAEKQWGKTWFCLAESGYLLHPYLYQETGLHIYIYLHIYICISRNVMIWGQCSTEYGQ